MTEQTYTFDFEERLRSLAQLRANREMFRKKLGHLRDAFNADPAYLEISEAAELTDASISDLEGAIRENAIDYFEETGEKQVREGVKVIMSTSINFDPQQAEDWARNNAPALLKLDLAAFKKFVKALPSEMRPGFVVETKTPAGRIGSKLDEMFPDALAEMSGTDVPEAGEELPF